MADAKPTAAIGIICKTPQPGASKTRLLSLLGPDGAAELAGCFLRDISAVIESIPVAVGCRGYAIYAPEGSEAALRRFIPATFGLVCRRNATLGVVLSGATEHLLAAGHDVVVLVNADSPTMPFELIRDAIAAAREPGDRVVLGPATDGGYYLIALKMAHRQLFEDIAWSTAAVLQQTLARAREIDLETRLLAPWYDIDDAASLAELIEELQAGQRPSGLAEHLSGPAAATRAFLARHPRMRETIRTQLAAAAGTTKS